MSISEIQGKNVPIKLWTPLHEVESVALDQLKNIAALPWVAHHIAVMPDVHFGKGATVGSVIAMRGALCPAAVGVDIGCGMAAIKTSLRSTDLPDNLEVIRSAIEAAIPLGFNSHEEPQYLKVKDHQLKARCVNHMKGFKDLTQKVSDLESRVSKQLGTLGGGNHFIELCIDTEGLVWMMLHSGSRNIGKTLAEFHINIAKTLGHNVGIPDRDLAVFLAATPEMQNYRKDLYWAQEYAMLNREVMLSVYKGVMRKFFPDITFEPEIKCHHNYVAEEIHYEENLFITRKGAISAAAGTMGIIPGSMGTGSYIVRGRGEPTSFNSASHGAGRRLSRGAAKRTYSLADLGSQTTGVVCRKDEGVLDEIPGAYKDIRTVMENQKDLVEIVAELKQVICCKG